MRPLGFTTTAIGAGALAAGLGWLLGRNGAYAALIVVLVALAGLRSVPSARAARVAWIAYASLAVGQAVVALLVVGRVIPDVSLTPILVGAHADWEHLAGHAFVQATFL